MTRYTIRDATTLAAVAVHDDLGDAVDALETERLAWQLNPPPGCHVLELVVTADDPGRDDENRMDGAVGDIGGAGDIVVRFASGVGPATSPDGGAQQAATPDA